MLRCNTCGKDIQTDTQVRRVMRTGSCTGGNAFYRTVNLCGQCDDQHTTSQRLAKVKISVLILVGAAALIGGSGYLWFSR